MERCVNGWKAGWMDGKVDGCKDNRWMLGWKDRWMGGKMVDGWKDNGWMEGWWMDGWMGRCIMNKNHFRHCLSAARSSRSPLASGSH